MEAIDNILTRCSIRKYTSEEVDSETIKKILECAMQAPSAKNQQPWHFVVVKNKVSLGALSQVSNYSWMVKDSKVTIVVCGDLKLEKAKGYWVQDCCAATQNMLLAAHALGLGAVWVGVYPKEERYKKVREILNIPEDIVPLCMVSIGYPDESKDVSLRYKEERVHKEKWFNA